MNLLSNLLPKKKEPTFNEQFVKFVNDEYTKRMNDRKPFELQWRLNLEMLNGNQYMDIDSAGQRLTEIPKLFWYQEREVFNQVAPITETRIARLKRQRPILKTRPASSEQRDIASSKVSSSLLNSTWFDQDMDEKYEEMIPWLETTGNVFLKPTWNANFGRKIGEIVQPSDDETAPQDKIDDKTNNDDVLPSSNNIDQLFGGGVNRIEIREGDIETSVCPAYEIFPDSSYRNSMRYVRSIIHARAFAVDEIEQIWGIQVESEDVEVMTLQEAKSGLGGIGYSVTRFYGGTMKLKNHAVVKEYYERPSKKYPQGRFIVVAGKKCLYAGPLPYMIEKDGEPGLPFIKIGSIDVPGCFWDKSVIERLIPIQRRYNALRNRKAEYLNLVTIGQWYEPEGSIDDDTELNNEPGNRIRYKAGFQRPEPVSFPNLPSSFENEIQTLLAEFTAISGVSELSRYGESPSGVKSGVALSIAVEQDDTRISMTGMRIANGIRKMGKYWLRLYRQFATEPRVLRDVGANNDIEVLEWTASDLTSDDVIVENSSALAETPAQRRQMVFDLLNTGIFNRPETNPFDQQTIEKIFEMLEFGNWEGGYNDDHNLQEGRARHENRIMMNGQQVMVQDFDDHEIHIQVHNRWRMQPEYDELLKTPLGTLIDAIMRQHIAQHQQVLIQRQQQAMMQQLQMAQSQQQKQQPKQLQKA